MAGSSNAFLLIFTFGAMVASADAAAPVCTSKSDFAAFCNNTLGGIVNGGRCFFSGMKKATWDDSWGVCTGLGGRGIAQVHTSNEFAAIGNYLKTKETGFLDMDLYTWVAHRQQEPRGNCWFGGSTSQWWSDDTTQTPNLVTNNTWVRTRHDDDCSPINTGTAGHIYSSFTKIGDEDPANSYYQLCEYDNPNQDYKHVPNTCITENPIMTFTSTTLVACQGNCNDQFWCRSFNFHTDTSTCELFTWAVSDNPTQAVVTNCWVYTYVP